MSSLHFDITGKYSNLDLDIRCQNSLKDLDETEVFSAEIIQKFNDGKLFTPDQKERLKKISRVALWILVGAGLIVASVFTGGTALLAVGIIIAALGGLSTLRLTLNHTCCPPSDFYIQDQREKMIGELSSQNLIEIGFSVKDLKRFSVLGNDKELYKSLLRIKILKKFYLEDTIELRSKPLTFDRLFEAYNVFSARAGVELARGHAASETSRAASLLNGGSAVQGLIVASNVSAASAQAEETLQRAQAVQARSEAISPDNQRKLDELEGVYNTQLESLKQIFSQQLKPLNSSSL